MKRYFINLVAALSALTLFFFVLMPLLVAGLVGASIQSAGDTKLPADVVLQLDLRRSMTDQPQFAAFDITGKPGPSVIGLIQTLERAEQDASVKGLYIRVGGGAGVPLSQAEEIRTALQSFKESGKFIIAHTQSFYTTGLGSYLAVSEVDQLWMQPTGSMSTSGIQIGSPFLKDFFEKIHAKPQFAQYHEYKSMANMYTQNDFTAAHRESYESLLASLYDNAMGEIANSKQITKVGLIDLFNTGPFLADEALSAGLIDVLGYHADAEQVALQKAGEDSEFVSIGDYAATAKAKSGGPVIAVVYAEGSIHLGNSSPVGDPSIGGDTVAKALRAAADDEDVQAIVFRVSSGGGSPDASDQIWQAVNYARSAGKPVVVTMGSMAASGGYYVAMSADRILALPNTITGSIGVVGGKIVIADTLGEIGVKFGEIEIGGPNTSMYSSQQEFTEEQWAAWRKRMGATYDDFTTKAAQGRNLTVGELREHAKGRIWTGSQALERGLVDQLGGFKDAIAEAKVLAGLDPQDDIRIKLFPGEKDPFERFMEAFGVSAQAAQVLLMFSDIEQVDQLVRAWEATSQNSNEAQLTMPQLDIN
jgi:protease-4